MQTNPSTGAPKLASYRLPEHWLRLHPGIMRPDQRAICEKQISTTKVAQKLDGAIGQPNRLIVDGNASRDISFVVEDIALLQRQDLAQFEPFIGSERSDKRRAQFEFTPTGRQGIDERVRAFWRY